MLLVKLIITCHIIIVRPSYYSFALASKPMKYTASVLISITLHIYLSICFCFSIVCSCVGGGMEKGG